MDDLQRQWSILRDKYKQFCELNECIDDKDLKQQCLNYLQIADKDNCFKLLPFYDAQNQLQKKIQNDGNIDLHNLEDAMENLEKYALNLLRKPWCKDFYTIKVFNGFFKYNIEQWVSFGVAAKILKLIGYHNKDAGIYTCDVDELVEDRVLAVSFELYLAHTLTKLFRSPDTHKSVEHLMENGLMEKQRNITNQLGQVAIANETEEIMRQKSVTTQGLTVSFDKNGQSTEADVTCSDSPTQPIKEQDPINPDDINDELLYGDENNLSTDNYDPTVGDDSRENYNRNILSNHSNDSSAGHGSYYQHGDKSNLTNNTYDYPSAGYGSYYQHGDTSSLTNNTSDYPSGGYGSYYQHGDKSNLTNNTYDYPSAGHGSYYQHGDTSSLTNNTSDYSSAGDGSYYQHGDKNNLSTNTYDYPAVDNNSYRHMRKYADGNRENNLTERGEYGESTNHEFHNTGSPRSMDRFASGYGQSYRTAQTEYHPVVYQGKYSDQGSYSSLPAAHLSPCQLYSALGTQSKDDSHVKLRGERFKKRTTTPQTSVYMNPRSKEGSKQDAEHLYENYNSQDHVTNDTITGHQDVFDEKSRIDWLLNKRIKCNEKSKMENRFHSDSILVDGMRDKQRKITCFICSNSRLFVSCTKCEMVFCKDCFQAYENKQSCSIGETKEHHYKNINDEVMSSMNSFPDYV